MRQIKFRAWDKIDKKIYDNVGLSLIGVQVYAHPDFQPPEEVIFDRGRDCFEIMQFTGLLDKNGKEIYEGDIVTVKYNDGSGYDNPVEVSFERGSFWVGMGYLNDVKIIEIIGNIHENPDLLKI